MPQRKAPSANLTNRGFRAANPELFQSTPGPEWDKHSLLNKIPDPNDSTKFIYQFAYPERLGPFLEPITPPISFGDDAPVPRWRLALDPTDSAEGKDLETDLIRTFPDKTIIDGVAPGSHPRSFDSSIGLGGLQWIFDPGLAATHLSSINGDMLYEVAWVCLTDALRNPISRKQINIEIANGPLWPKVCNVEDPLPPPPERPKTNIIPQPETPKVIRKPAFQNYDRPSLNAKAKGSGPDPEGKTSLNDRIFHHQKGTDGPLYQADPQKVLKKRSSDNSGIGEGPATTKRKLRSSEPGEIEAQEGKTEKMGEYKCVWFCVILLVLSMFLCLFLYSFGIIKVM